MNKPVRPKTYDRPGYRSQEQKRREQLMIAAIEMAAEAARYQREIEL